MRKRTLNIIYILTAVTFLVFLIRELRFNFSATKNVTGWVTSLSTSGAGGIRIDYKFKVGNKIYSGYGSEHIYLRDCNCQINDSLLIEYTTETPADSRIKRLSCHYIN